MLVVVSIPKLLTLALTLWVKWRLVFQDSPYNPAVIADNVGDNVGDVAGMGADLFESYAGAIIGTMVLGLGFHSSGWGEVGLGPVILPLMIAAGGIVCSIIGTFFVSAKEGASTTQIQHALIEVLLVLLV